MNTNLRAILFGAAVAAALTVTLDTVTAAERVSVPAVAPTEIVHLDTVYVVAHRDAFDAEGNLKAGR